MNWIIEVLVDMIDPEVEYPAKRKESWHRYGIQMAHMRNRLYGTNYMNPIQVFLIIFRFILIPTYYSVSGIHHS